MKLDKRIYQWAKMTGLQQGMSKTYLKNYARGIFESELTEYYDALDIEDEETSLIQQADALGDMMFLLYQMAYMSRIDLEKVLEKVTENNETKLLEYVEDLFSDSDTYTNGAQYAQAMTGKTEDARGIRLYYLPFVAEDKQNTTRIVMKSAVDQTDNNGKFWPKDKVVKPYLYKELNLTIEDITYYGP